MATAGFVVGACMAPAVGIAALGSAAITGLACGNAGYGAGSAVGSVGSALSGGAGKVIQFPHCRYYFVVVLALWLYHRAVSLSVDVLPRRLCHSNFLHRLLCCRSVLMLKRPRCLVLRPKAERIVKLVIGAKGS